MAAKCDDGWSVTFLSEKNDAKFLQPCKSIIRSNRKLRVLGKYLGAGLSWIA